MSDQMVEDEVSTTISTGVRLGESFLCFYYDPKEETLRFRVCDYTNGLTGMSVNMVAVQPEELNALSDALKKLYFHIDNV